MNCFFLIVCLFPSFAEFVTMMTSKWSFNLKLDSSFVRYTFSSHDIVCISLYVLLSFLLSYFFFFFHQQIFKNSIFVLSVNFAVTDLCVTSFQQHHDPFYAFSCDRKTVWKENLATSDEKNLRKNFNFFFFIRLKTLGAAASTYTI